MTNRECPRCKGTGEETQQGFSINRRSGVRAVDPQKERSQTCRVCDGKGTVR